MLLVRVRPGALVAVISHHSRLPKFSLLLEIGNHGIGFEEVRVLANVAYDSFVLPSLGFIADDIVCWHCLLHASQHAEVLAANALLLVDPRK